MACPTCGHTMSKLNTDPNPVGASGVFWCPRCGTLSEVTVTGFRRDESPKLVERCRILKGLIDKKGADIFQARERMEHVGVNEAINPPGERS